MCILHGDLSSLFTKKHCSFSSPFIKVIEFFFSNQICILTFENINKNHTKIKLIKKNDDIKEK